MGNIFASRHTKLLQNPTTEECKSAIPVKNITRVCADATFFTECLETAGLSFIWIPESFHETVTYVELDSSSSEYKEVKQLFKETNKRHFKVTKIVRVENPYLMLAYQLKKEEAGSYQEKLLFHGTKAEHIDNICKNNFDWRRHGYGLGHYYGRGISFTSISNHATQFCDSHWDKVVLLVKVIIRSTCLGAPSMRLPPQGFDTTQKEDGSIVVKYDDNEFYPAYKIYFTDYGYSRRHRNNMERPYYRNYDDDSEDEEFYIAWKHTEVLSIT